TRLISPDIVKRMAEANGVSLGIGILSHSKIIQSTKQNRGGMDLADTTVCKPRDKKDDELSLLHSAFKLTLRMFINCGLLLRNSLIQPSFESMDFQLL
nr:pyridoxal phosphate-dependent transferase [Tanacetum cinerariifolium]